MSIKFKQLIDHFSKLPGIGPRHATRLVLAMLTWNNQQLQDFGSAIHELKTGTTFCSECFNVSDADVCSICSNLKRDHSRIAVVEHLTDLLAIEKTGVFNGTYHVLGGSINPAYGGLPNQLKIPELISRIQKLQNDVPNLEVILATNPNTYGETTALYLEEELRPLNLTVTRLARGLAAGSSVEYADAITLANALKHRH